MEAQMVEEQMIVQGPMASQVAIKMLGTNGGGYVNANAAHPFENPTPLSNFLQMLSIFAIGSGLTYYLGRMVEEPGARLVGLGRDDDAVPGGACWCAGGRKRPAIRFTSDSASRRRTAIWRARRCASASSIPPCSPPSPRTLRAAR